MKRILLTICTLAGLYFACSKSPSPSPASPTGPGNGSHDTIPKPPDSTHDTVPKPPTPPPPTETPGVTKIGGLLDWSVFLYLGFEMDGGGIDNYVRLIDYDTSHCSVEIINAYKGTCKIAYEVYQGDTTVAFVFSNLDYWTSQAQADHPDTAGIVQIHVYRKDGKNIKPGLKDIYMPIGTASGNNLGQGEVTIESYTGICRNLTLDSLVNMVNARSKLTLINSDGF